jgi:Rhodopirellula transposase DDE domain
LEGAQQVDRDAQFRYLNQQARAQLAAGQPVVSVDTKKKELVGRFANGGREWQPTGEPDQVNVHDLPDPTLGKAIPYGVYDPGRNSGRVGAGVDHDTAAFAVQTLRRWWQQVGRLAYPQATRLLVGADAGGSNGHRVRAWKTELARLATETGPGDHRGSPAAGDLQGEPDRAPAGQHHLDELAWPPADQPRGDRRADRSDHHPHGLRVRAELDRGRCPLGVMVGDGELAAVPLARHELHGEWNYTMQPAAEEPPPTAT